MNNEDKTAIFDFVITLNLTTTLFPPNNAKSFRIATTKGTKLSSRR